MNHLSPASVFGPHSGPKWYRAILVPVVLFSFCCAVRSMEPAEADKAGLVLEGAEPWTPRAETAPKTSRTEAADVVIEANGTPTCAGGWQFHFANVRGDQAYRIHAKTVHHDLAHPTRLPDGPSDVGQVGPEGHWRLPRGR